jgi:hypothetical protein
MNKKQRKSAQKRRKVYRELDESMAKGRKFLKKETDKKGNLSQRAKNLQQAIKAARRRGTVSTMMGKGGGDIADKLKTLKDGGSVKKFPDLSGDGKVTQKDILMGRGVIKKKRGGKVTGRSIGPAGASIVSDDGKKIKQLKKIQKSLLPLDAASVGAVGAIKGLSKLAGRLAKRGYGKAKK